MDATGAMLALMKLQALSTGLGQRLELPSIQFLEAALHLKAREKGSTILSKRTSATD